jgi:hypothetical protein
MAAKQHQSCTHVILLLDLGLEFDLKGTLKITRSSTGQSNSEKDLIFKVLPAFTWWD